MNLRFVSNKKYINYLTNFEMDLNSAADAERVNSKRIDSIDETRIPSKLKRFKAICFSASCLELMQSSITMG